MPRLSEISQENRDDLKGAITRFGGYDKFCALARLIPYKEWQYFESQLDLLLRLRQYLREFHGGREDFFPPTADVLADGYETLHEHIQQLGGRKLIASRLGMHYSFQMNAHPSSNLIELQYLNFGPFTLDFAIRLMQFVRADMMQMSSPLAVTMIKMPTAEKLNYCGEASLALEVRDFGGTENVARRLGLAL